ncbi:MAG: hypothetical protein JO022_14585, partial [Acidobacteriaceae bacterium]|nr:hypothetical protein [Acidobacteriaceae bacterium]
ASASKTLVIANLPDISKTAYLLSVPKLAALLHVPVGTVMSSLGLNLGDLVTPYGIEFALSTQLTQKLPDVAPPNPPNVIRAAKVLEIQATIIAYNIDIAIEALINGATLVDVYSLVNDLAANGIVVNGKKLTTDFGGGLFSEDGIHPTAVGYAIIANEFIKTMNRQNNAGIPPVSVNQVAKTDPLFPKEKQASVSGHVSADTANALQALRAQ